MASQPCSAQALAFLWDHRVQNRMLLPGTAMFEFAAAAAAALAGDGALPGLMTQTLAALSIISPKVLPGLAAGSSPGSSAGSSSAKGGLPQQVSAAADTLLCEVDTAAGQLKVLSEPAAGSSASAPAHLKSDIVLTSTAAASAAEKSASAGGQRRRQRLVVEALQLKRQGIPAAGSSSSSGGHTVAQPRLQEAAAAAHAESFIMHPAVADAVLHLGAVHVAVGSSRVSRVPVGMDAYSCCAGASADR